MFALIMAVAIIVTVVVYTVLWRSHKREQATADRLAGGDKRVGRHRATNRPTMTWRG